MIVGMNVLQITCCKLPSRNSSEHNLFFSFNLHLDYIDRKSANRLVFQAFKQTDAQKSEEDEQSFPLFCILEDLVKSVA